MGVLSIDKQKNIIDWQKILVVAFNDKYILNIFFNKWNKQPCIASQIAPCDKKTDIPEYIISRKNKYSLIN